MSERPCRVGYVLRKFPVLSETFILNELLALEERGLDLHLFSLHQPNDPRFHESLPRLRARVDYVPGWSRAGKLLRHNRRVAARTGRIYRSAALRAAAIERIGARAFLQAGYVANEARRLKLDHLHAQFANTPTVVARYAAEIADIPFSFTAHAMDIFKAEVRTQSLRRSLDRAKFAVTVSEFNRQYLNQVASDDARIHRIYNGIDLELFCPNGLSAPAPFRILTVARLVEKKGLSILIDACAQLRDRGHEFRCEIVGKGRLRSVLHDQIRRLGLDDHVHLLGPRTQQEVRELYRQAHLYVLPCVVGRDGNRDGLPVSIVEALACGLPVVTTPVTGIPEVIHDGLNGLLVPMGDASALATAIASILDDEDLHATLRAHARPSVEGSFDLKQTAAQLCQLFGGGAS